MAARQDVHLTASHALVSTSGTILCVLLYCKATSFARHLLARLVMCDINMFGLHKDAGVLEQLELCRLQRSQGAMP